MKRYLIASAIGFAAWSWLALCFWLAYLVNPWKACDVQFAIVGIGLSLPLLVVCANILASGLSERP